MKRHDNFLAKALLGTAFAELKPVQQQVIQDIAKVRPAVVAVEDAARSGFGQRLADKVATFGGSWTFIMIFGAILATWVTMNALVLTGAAQFDPYPFVFLNLVLSMLAAVQAPIIMMSQNRQSEVDRLAAGTDYQLNLKAEIEIMELHRKIDALTAMVARSLPDRPTA